MFFFPNLSPSKKAIITNVIDFLLQLLILSIFLINNELSIFIDIGITISSILGFAFFIEAIHKRSIFMIICYLSIISYLIVLVFIGTIESNLSVFNCFLRVIWYFILVLQILNHFLNCKYLYTEFGLFGFINSIEASRREDHHTKHHKRYNNNYRDNFYHHHTKNHVNYHMIKMNRNLNDELENNEMVEDNLIEDNLDLDESFRNDSISRHSSISIETLTESENNTKSENLIFTSSSSDSCTIHDKESKNLNLNDKNINLKNDKEIKNNLNDKSLNLNDKETKETKNDKEIKNIKNEKFKGTGDLTNHSFSEKKHDIFIFLIIRHLVQTFQRIFLIFSIIIYFSFLQIENSNFKILFLILRSIIIMTMIIDNHDFIFFRILHLILKILNISLIILILLNVKEFKISICYDLFANFFLFIFLILDIKGVKMKLNKKSEKIEWKRMSL